jgi:hypothetical protein
VDLAREIFFHFQVDLAPSFYWMQGVEDMVVWVMLPEGTTKRDLKVTLKPSEIVVKIGNEEKLVGRLWNVLDGDSMTWSVRKFSISKIVFLCKLNAAKITLFLVYKEILLMVID